MGGIARALGNAARFSRPRPLMNEAAALTYLLQWEQENVPVLGSLGLGAHPDNAVVIADSQVADFHARIDLSDRGPVCIPLALATVMVNGRLTHKPQQLIPGDVVTVGARMMQVGIEVESYAGAAQRWSLRAERDGAVYPLYDEMTIGRGAGCDVLISHPHVSRHHARLWMHHGFVWLQALHSANGSRGNGQRLWGGARLLHGDQLSFDRVNFQLLAEKAPAAVARVLDRKDYVSTDSPPAAPLSSTLPRKGNKDGWRDRWRRQRWGFTLGFGLGIGLVLTWWLLRVLPNW